MTDPFQPSSMSADGAPPARLSLDLFPDRNDLLRMAFILMLWVGLLPMCFRIHELVISGGTSLILPLVLASFANFAWQVWHLHRGLSIALREPTEQDGLRHPFTNNQPIMYVVGQLALGLLCNGMVPEITYNSVHIWIWWGATVPAIFMFERVRNLALVIVLIIISCAAQDYCMRGAVYALYSILALVTGATTTTCFALGARHALAQRWKMGRMAMELQAANKLIAQQAEASSALAITQERNRLAREIHDSVGHTITLVGAQLDAALAVMGSAPEAAALSMKKARDANLLSLTEIRRSIYDLTHERRSDETLSESLQRMAVATERQGLEVAFMEKSQSRALPPMVEHALYRSVQECLTNILRHSKACKVLVELDYTDPNQVNLIVRDNGQGLAETTGGSGLRGLAARAEVLGGSFLIYREGPWRCIAEMVLPF
jgi:signal transduction histidine kinase